MSLHKSKGLTVELVVIAGAVEDLQVRHGRRVGENFVTFTRSFLGEIGRTLLAAIRGEDWVNGLQ